jgi:hypothetical protein
LTVKKAAAILLRVAPHGERAGERGTESAMVQFNGVKVFSATKAKERDELGETVTRWMRGNPELEVVDREVRQSSDDEFHCLTIILFYRPKGP